MNIITMFINNTTVSTIIINWLQYLKGVWFFVWLFDSIADWTTKKKSITGVIAKLLFLERSNREISTLQTNRKIKFIMNLFKWSSTADLIIYIISHFTYLTFWSYFAISITVL